MNPRGLKRGTKWLTKPVEEWPILDREAWHRAHIPGDPLDPGGFALRWAPVSRRAIEGGYGYWLNWLDGRGQLDPLQTPAARVTKTQVRDYIAHLRSVVAPFTVQARVQELGDALRAIAEHKDWKWLLRAAARIRARAVSVRNKRAHLQGPHRLVQLGIDLMAQADASLDGPVERTALLFRDGLVIALLASRPIRMRNLHMITIGQHLLGSGPHRVVFACGETKNRRPFEFSWPPSLGAALERYLTVYRPFLLGGGKGALPETPRLWVSRNGTPLCRGALSHWIKKRTKAAFGKHICPHWFRDDAATAIAIFDPEHVHIIAPVLGHSSLATSEAHYNQARTLEAGRRLHGTIASLRKGAKSRAMSAQAPCAKAGRDSR